MTEHKVGTRDEWLEARKELLEQEKELTRRSDELARQRQELPWVLVDKEYAFETSEGTKTLPQLFDGRSQLFTYHFMFGPSVGGWPEAGCLGLLIHGGLARRRRRPRRQPGCDVRGRVARAHREARGLQAADGLALPVVIAARTC